MVGKKRPVTSASVAREYFQKEMALHGSTDCDPKTIMLIHDSCYGHRYSRPRTSKPLLSTIVERPERIHASILGLSAAYVRMGGRHEGGLAPPHPDRDSRTSVAVPFKIHNTTRSVPLNSAAATHVHGQKWMEELQIMCDSAEGKLALNGKELVRPIGYGKDENGNPLPKLHEGDLYLCPESLNALEGCLGGVCDAVDTVFGSGNTSRAFVCIRPPGHHCSSNYPSGFCWINNVHVGITHAAISHGLTHAAIIDFDLHHGDGSQMVAWEHNRKALKLPKNAAPHKKTPIGYFSLHDINSYPCEMGDEEKVRNASLCIENAHGQSIWNVHLEPWKSYADFWRLYDSKYTVLIDKTRNFLRSHSEKLSNAPIGVKPKAAIFLSAGFDASEWEGEGMQRHKVNVPTDFYARFTADVVRLAEEEGLGVDGRVISVLEGGYSDRALTSGVLSHVCGLTQHSGSANASEPVPGDGLSAEMRMKLGMLKLDGRPSIGDRSRPDDAQFDAEWWNLANLESLETLVNPTTTQPGATRTKDKATGNYSSPTQASTAKITDQARVRRSLSGQIERMTVSEPEPVPPPPEVDWATAAYELSRILIPTNRQTLSCTYDELNAEATRVKRERQSTIGLPTSGEQRMQLRDRKAKPSSDEDVSKPANRRKTIAAVGDLPDPNLGRADNQADASNRARPRRRSSGASSILAGFQNMQIGDPTSRASSVMSEKPKERVIVKKPRTVTAPRSQPAKPKSGPKTSTAQPVPRVPSAFVAHRDNIAQMAPSTSDIVTDEIPSSQARSGATSRVSTADDLADTSSVVKKMSIKLNLPSPEENAEREKKAAEAKVRKPRLKKPTAPKAPSSATINTARIPVAIVKPAGETNDNSDVHSTVPLGTTEVPLSPQPATTASSNDLGRAESELPAPNQVSAVLKQHPELSEDMGGLKDFVTPVTENVKPDASQEVPAAIVDNVPTSELIPYQRRAEEQIRPSVAPALSEQPISSFDKDQPGLSNHDPPFADATPVASSVAIDSAKYSDTFLPSTPNSTKRTKADLPVFTSSSPIPFGRPVLSNLNESLQPSDVQVASHKISAETMEPAIMNTVSEDTAKAGQVVVDGQWKIGSDASEASGPSRASEASIWDVPETPQR